MIDYLVRIGNGPTDIMYVERSTPDNATFYGEMCRGGLGSSSAQFIKKATPQDMETWNAWRKVRNEYKERNKGRS